MDFLCLDCHMVGPLTKPVGMCGKCQKEITGEMDLSSEMVRNIGGRQ